ncbi:VWA domain-containing protein [Lentisphaera profundi]|uniref:VWA domain-containing protein n=1 Tax=Lentisphaera profundi TaxID=1658616 RepID=A0ABY7VTJ9_9BACT|nr:VWA domain-containing protein [Lentisphaera profundi]WDE96207.1 VWA domain-containing protein [Lentisphaera profundi]
MLNNFHFIRPQFLWILIPMTLLAYLLIKKHHVIHLWSKVIAPHLLEHLLIESGNPSRIRPHHIFCLLAYISIFSLAGPSYKKEASPFTEDKAALVIILKTTPSMLAQDIQPNRLTRATQKIHDLLELRPGTKASLIAYAGSAHIVLPLTEDHRIISSFASELDPSIMPKEGSALPDALKLADKILKQGSIPGSVLLITDAITKQEQENISSSQFSFAVQVYASAGPAGTKVPIDSPIVQALDIKALNQLASRLRGSLVHMTVDKSDLVQLDTKIENSMQASLKEGGERWQDSGYYLVPFLLLLSLMWFRKGWRLNYE